MCQPGLNNNTISAKDEPVRAASSSPPSSPALKSSSRYNNHLSPASSMHLDENLESSSVSQPQRPHSKSPQGSEAKELDNEQEEDQAEDLSKAKRPRMSEAATEFNHSQQNNQSRSYYNCHSEVMIKSE